MHMVKNAFKIAFIGALLAAAWSMVMPQDGTAQGHTVIEPAHMTRLADLLRLDVTGVENAYREVAKNVRTVLRRQYANTPVAGSDQSDSENQDEARPVCKFEGEDVFAAVLGAMAAQGVMQTGDALFTLARVYDEAHITLCHGRRATRGQAPDELFRTRPRIDLVPLAEHLKRDPGTIDGQIVLQPGKSEKPYRATWRPMPPLDFDRLPRLKSLGGLLPGEKHESQVYAGIGGGGGSDIISASLLGLLLQRHGKKMDLLVSTRTWATGSQGKEGSKMGIRRTIWGHDGHVEVNGRSIPGTFRVTKQTSSEGRPLEAIPVPNHSQIFIVLDQGESTGQIAEEERADLKDQLQAVLGQATDQIQTVAIVDTGGDVFGADTGSTSTPDQDLRVQQAICATNHVGCNLVTAVIAPGVDAPDDAPTKALKAGGQVYKPTDEEKAMLLKVLSKDYKMDGSVPGRFGKTTMALQARLKGHKGWTSLDLPPHIVDTWENPWSSFVYIRECMSDIVLMPTEDLLPYIDPIAQKKLDS
jgi:hypothetical protein